MEKCRYFRGDRPCKYYWVDQSWDCNNCTHNELFRERILLIKLDALGDVLRSTPLAEGIKKKYPYAQLTWLVKKGGEIFVENNSHVDRVLIYNEESVRRLQCEQFDILINLDKDPKATSMAMLFKARNKRGYGWHEEGYVIPLNDGAKYHYNICLDNYGAKTRNSKCYQEMIFEMAGLNYSMENLVLNLNPEKARRFKEDFYLRYNISDNDYVIVMNTGCGPVYPNKKWTYEGFLHLIKLLVQHDNVKIILAGAEAELERNARLCNEVQSSKVINTTNQYDLENFCFMLNSANMVLTGDTVGLHVAIALKKKIVSFFGPTPHQEIHLFGLGKKFVREELSCLNCYDQFPCPHGGKCMTLITPDEVYREVMALK